MVQVDKILKEINLKLVYYGAGLSGKTTNVEYIYNHTLPEIRGKLVSIKTDTDRTLFFDFLPLDLGTIRGMRLRIHLYSVAGQVFYDASRKLVLSGCDGIVFVVDSQRECMNANLESMENLKQNMLLNSLTLSKTPLVLQYNKSDLQNILQPAELREIFNPKQLYPEFFATASKGIGVFDTFKCLVKNVMRTTKF